MNKAQKIVIDLPSGDQLVAEECPYADGPQIAVGIVRDGIWLQDLVLVESKLDEDFKPVDDKFSVYLYEDEDIEDYTCKTEISRVQDNAL